MEIAFRSSHFIPPPSALLSSFLISVPTTNPPRQNHSSGRPRGSHMRWWYQTWTPTNFIFIRLTLGFHISLRLFLYVLFFELRACCGFTFLAPFYVPRLQSCSFAAPAAGTDSLILYPIILHPLPIRPTPASTRLSARLSPPPGTSLPK